MESRRRDSIVSFFFGIGKAFPKKGKARLDACEEKLGTNKTSAFRLGKTLRTKRLKQFSKKRPSQPFP
ncbi:MAG: hypothetical protein Q8O53_03295 [Candidatus Moranbacteria bacterium]|nr:hypothetical protein [Candidatus Moranbacteria bacterium]